MHREAQVVCVLIPRFTLLAALRKTGISLAGNSGSSEGSDTEGSDTGAPELPDFAAKRNPALLGPIALAPEPDREQVVGEVSGAAEAHGIHPGMRLGEAL